MGRHSVAAMIEERVLGSKRCFWKPADFSGSFEAVNKALERLTAAGHLRRVRRGLYWRGDSTPLGMAPPSIDDLISEIVGSEGNGPAGWTAALALGLTTQVPREVTIAVGGRPPTNVPGVHFVSRSARGRRDSRLRTLEIALLEVLRSWEDIVDYPREEAAPRLIRMIREGRLRPDRLARAAATEPATVRERLRLLLRAAGEGRAADRIPPARSVSTRLHAVVPLSA